MRLARLTQSILSSTNQSIMITRSAQTLTCAALVALASLNPAPSPADDHANEAKPDTNGEQPPEREVPTEHKMQELAGYQVRVDQRLFEKPNKELGRKALQILEARLRMIEVTMPEKAVEQMQGILIQLDLDHDGLNSMQYHPSADWLRKNGYSEDLEKVVHLPRARSLLSQANARKMPWVILHELAHGYHDQILGFDHAGILEHYRAEQERGDLDEVLHASGKTIRHYALTDHKEWFAEMTEAYFGSNDFYPFVRAELAEFDAKGHDIIKETWGD